MFMEARAFRKFAALDRLSHGLVDVQALNRVICHLRPKFLSPDDDNYQTRRTQQCDITNRAGPPPDMRDGLPPTARALSAKFLAVGASIVAAGGP